MHQYKTFRWVVITAIVAAVLYWFIGLPSSKRSVAKLDGVDTPVSLDLVPESPLSKEPAQTESATNVSMPAETEAPCLTPEQLKLRFLEANHANRLDKVGINGPTIASYRDLSSNELRGLAIQGDSAAMAVLGAVSIMRSSEWPEDKAVSYLLGEGVELNNSSMRNPLSEADLKHLEEAQQWFYKAALHGRVLALNEVGMSIALRGGGPVEIGWITEDEYASLSAKDQANVDPLRVFSVLPYELAPELRDGIMSTFINQVISKNPVPKNVLNRAKEKFLQDLNNNNLPPISVEASNSPPFEELASNLCKGELDSN